MNRNSKRGITLVELIVALTLTSIFAVLCVALINPIERTYRGTLKLARAQLLADTLVDSIRKECDDVKHDEKMSVWIGNLDSQDDSDLIDKGPAIKGSSGNVLVFQRNNNYTEAIYSCAKLSEKNISVYKNTESDHAVNALIIYKGDEKTEANIDYEAMAANTQKGIVHFGYYKAKEDERGVFPIEAYDYTNPVLASTYGDFTVDVGFKQLTLTKSEKTPVYVLCTVKVLQKGTELYKRTAVLCFAANGSGSGSGSKPTPKPVKNVRITLLWNDTDNTKRPADGVTISLKNSSGTEIVRYKVSDVKSGNKQEFAFYDVDNSNGVNLAVIPDKIPDYTYDVKSNSVGFKVTFAYEKVDTVKLISGPDFIKALGTGVKEVIFDSFAAHSDIVSSVTGSNVAINVNGKGGRLPDYKLYKVADGDGNITAYILSESGKFVANEDCTSMFEGCIKLENITGLTNINTHRTKKMDKMFRDCRLIKHFEMPGFVTSTCESTAYMFEKCFSCISYDFSDWNTSNVKTMQKMFQEFHSSCRRDFNNYAPDASITLDLSNFDFSSCTDMSSMFGWFYDIQVTETIDHDSLPTARSITQIILPSNPKIRQGTKINMEGMFAECLGVTSIVGLDKLASAADPTSCKDMFKDCQSLVRVNLPFASGSSSCTSTQSMFEFCKSLKDVNLGSIDLKNCTTMLKMFKDSGIERVYDFSVKNLDNVTNINELYKNCTSLGTKDDGKVSLNLQLGDKVTTAESVFYGCTGIVTAQLNGFDFKNVTSAKEFFRGCTNLTTLEMRNVKMPKCEHTGNMIDDCPSLAHVDMNGIVLPLLKDIDFLSKPSIKYIDLSNADLSGLTRLNKLFTGMNIEEFYMSDVELTKCYSTALMFSGCQNLKTVNMNNFKLNYSGSESVTYQEMFQNCSSLVTLSLKGMSSGKANNFSKMFNGCTSLENLDVSNWYFADSANLSYLFSGCPNLKNLDVSGWENVKPGNVSYMFNGCAKLESVDVSSWSNANISNVNHMFSGCTSLTTIDLSSWNETISDSVTAVPANNMFEGCSSLTTVIFANENSSWNTSKVTTMSGMFKNCTNLGGTSGEVDLSNLVSSLCTSMKEAFYGCTSLKTLKMNNVDLKACSDYTDFITGCSEINTVEIKESDLTAAMGLSFLNKAKEVYLSGSTFGMPKLEKSFSDSGLEIIDLSNTKLPNCTSFSQLFMGCKRLKTVKMAGLYTPELTNCSSMFSNCYSLNIARGDTAGWDSSKVTNVNNMFYYACYRGDGFIGPDDAVIDISGLKFNKITDFTQMFYCDKNTYNPSKDVLKTIVLPSGDDAIDNASNVVTYRMFNCREHLTELENVNQLYFKDHKDARSTFARTGLTVLDISKLDLNKITSQADFMFNENSKLTTIYVNPDLANTNNFATKFSGKQMFSKSPKLVGQNNTHCDGSNNVNGSRAVVDGVNGKEGYFSVKQQQTGG